MNKKIKTEYKKKLNLINKYNEYYYNESNSLVSDKEYDDLKKEILQLENDYNFLKSIDSPSQVVGYKPSKNFNKYPHKVPMLSLANAFTEEDLINFEKKIKNYL